MAKLLKPYGVTSTDVKIGGINRKGYRREHLHDAWRRYLPPGQRGSATPATSATAQVNNDDQVAGSGCDALPATPPLPLTSQVAQVARVADPQQACAVCGQPMTACEDGQTTHPWCDPGPPMTAAELAAAGFPAGLAEDTAS